MVSDEIVLRSYEMIIQFLFNDTIEGKNSWQWRTITKCQEKEAGISCEDITRSHGIRGGHKGGSIYQRQIVEKDHGPFVAGSLGTRYLGYRMDGRCVRGGRVRERNARPDTLRARITRIDAGGAPRNTGCPAAARPVLSDSCFRGDWIF